MARNRTNYNKRYNRNIVSRRPSDDAPYSNEYQPDVAQLDALKGPKPFGYTQAGGFTLSTYDARPPLAIDQYCNFEVDNGFNQFEDGTEETILDTQAAFTIPVPPGRTFVLKEILISINFLAEPSIDEQPIVDQYGFGAAALRSADVRYSVLVNNTPAENYGSRRLVDITTSYQRIPTFVLAGGLSNLTFIIDTSFTAQTEFFTIFGSLYGDYLFTTGTSLIQEPLNKNPVPIKDAYREKIYAPQPRK